MFANLFSDTPGIYALVGLLLIGGSLAIAVYKRLSNNRKGDLRMRQAINGIPPVGDMKGVPGLLKRATLLEDANEEVVAQLRQHTESLDELKFSYKALQMSQEEMQKTIDIILERSEALIHNSGTSMADQSWRSDQTLRLIAEKLGVEPPAREVE